MNCAKWGTDKNIVINQQMLLEKCKLLVNNVDFTLSA